MIHRSATLSLLVVQLATGPAFAQAASTALPRNTIDCRDWTHNADGSWTAHDNAKPFDVGNGTGATLHSTRITAHHIAMGGFDLWSVLNEKCGAQR